MGVKSVPMYDKLKFCDYQNETAVTDVYTPAIDKIVKSVSPKKRAKIAMLLRLMYVSEGLGSEVGELQGKLKKVLRDSEGGITMEAHEAMVAEIGDILWYVSQLCRELGVSMGRIAFENLMKLRDRKNRGKIQGSGDKR